MFCMLSIVLEHDLENNKQNINSTHTIFCQVHDVSHRQFFINRQGNFQSLAPGLSTLEVYFGVDRCENRGRSTTMVPCDKGSSVFV